MKVAVVAPAPVPFATGGAERLFDGLKAAINNDTPHSTELIKVPVRESNLPEVVDSYLAASCLDLGRFDLVISTKYPSWMVRHERHVLYMLHPLRGLYDSYPPDWGVVPDRGLPEVDRLVTALEHARSRGSEEGIFGLWDDALRSLGHDHPAFAFPGPLARAIVRSLDTIALSQERIGGYFSISRRVATRPGYFPPGVSARALIPPSNLDGFHPGGQSGFFTASRLDRPKRLDLLIAAMQHVRSDVALTIAGTGPDLARLQELAKHDPRVSFSGFVSDDELIECYANALAVPFVPFDEDLGYITIEAMRCGTPVITCSDSGGPTELVRDGFTGLVTEPSATAVGRGLQRLVDDQALALRLGEAGRREVEQITWAPVVRELLDTTKRAHPAPLSTRGSGHGRPRVLILSTYPAVPARHGGQLRARYLYGPLAEHVDVDYLCLDDGVAATGTTQPWPGFRQTILVRNDQFIRREGELHLRAKIPVTDIAAALEWQCLPELVTHVHRAANAADLAILAHPYLLPALQHIAPTLPFVYDAHNAEYEMKAQLLESAPLAPDFVAVVEEVERRAVRSAELIVASSETDQSLLQRLGPTLAEWTLIPNGAAVAHSLLTTGPKRRQARERWLETFGRYAGNQRLRHLAVFVASYHPPNLEAAEQIVAAAPDLPEVLFLLLGSHASHFEGWWLPENVVPRGFVSSDVLQQLLAIADVALNPMRSGGGTNLKLVEYFAAGVPVVSSEFGARGFDVEDGVHLVLADGQDLAPAIRRVILDERADERAARARELAAERYDWRIFADQFSASILSVLTDGAPIALTRAVLTNVDGIYN